MSKNINIPLLNQIELRQLDSNTISVIVKVNSYDAGKLDLKRKVFISAKRTAKNLFLMFQGLGLNEEILSLVMPYFSIEKIEVPYNGELLKTTRTKWLGKGIKSPFGNNRVDQQIILPLKKINMEDDFNHPMKASQPFQQLALFGGM